MKRYIFFLFFLMITPLANAQNEIMLSIFPQVADGVYGDGGYYKTTFMILPGYNPSSPTITCTLVLYGLGVNLDGQRSASQWTITIAQDGYYAASSAADQSLRTGYATLTCSDYVYAQALYTSYAKDGTKIAEATVFASDGDIGGWSTYKMIADQRVGSQLGIAIANNTDLPRTYQVTINSVSGRVTIPAHTSTGKFLTEIVPGSSNTVGIVTIDSTDSSEFYAIGLKYTGVVFTTLPAN
jgi:hypothetical protein